MLQVVDIVVASELPPDAGLLAPVPASGTDEVVLEPRDGSNIRAVPVDGVLLERGSETLVKLAGVRATSLVTDARVTFACSRFDTGGGWRGDPVSMAVFNSVSKVRAALRSQGKMLVGQIRFPWLARVGSTPKSGWGSQERLAFDVEDDLGGTWRLTLALAGGQDAAELSADIVRRAARYRLASEDLDDEELRALQRLTEARPVAYRESRAKHEAVFHEFPTCWRVSEKSARLEPR